MTANVPTIESGTARLGMTVAERFRRKRKITRMTSAIVSPSVNWTSWTDSRMATERSYTTLRLTDAARRERARVDLHAHGVLLRAEDRDLRHAGDGGDPLGEVRLRVLVDLIERQCRRAQREVDHRLIGRIDLLVEGRDRQVRRQE